MAPAPPLPPQPPLPPSPSNNKLFPPRPFHSYMNQTSACIPSVSNMISSLVPKVESSSPIETWLPGFLSLDKAPSFGTGCSLDLALRSPGTSAPRPLFDRLPRASIESQSQSKSSGSVNRNTVEDPGLSHVFNLRHATNFAPKMRDKNKLTMS
mmetsp:Transcript_10791/g.14689  ORF Transcript_10791/g.14689 Transcript_10791/m.14689 type:complete len:153 (-) Transcript_10791:222-680(-)